MNVGELKKLLDKHPDDLEVISCRFSDYAPFSDTDVSVINAVPQDWGIMRSHPTMSEHNKAKEKQYLCLA